MARALARARRASGRTFPNPPVGAVLVRGDRVLGARRDAAARRPARRDRGARTRRARGTARARCVGATLAVTLEPCCHHGRTPPCTDALLAAGIRRVWVGQRDPNPQRGGPRPRPAPRAPASRCCSACARPSAAPAPRLPLGAAARPALGLAQARGDARRPHRDCARRVALDHRARRARPRAPAARRRRRRDGGRGHGRERRPRAVGAPGRPARAHARCACWWTAASRPAERARLFRDADAARTWLLTRRGHRRAALRAPHGAGRARSARARREAGISTSRARSGCSRARVSRTSSWKAGAGSRRRCCARGLVDELHWFVAPSLLGGDARPALGPLAIETLARARAARGARRCAGSARTCTFGPCCLLPGGSA